MTTRRSFITGLISFVAAPAIVRAGSLMPVRVMEPLIFAPNMTATEVLLIDDAFLASIFRTLQAFPEMTATQIMARANQLGAFD